LTSIDGLDISGTCPRDLALGSRSIERHDKLVPIRHKVDRGQLSIQRLCQAALRLVPILPRECLREKSLRPATATRDPIACALPGPSTESQHDSSRSPRDELPSLTGLPLPAPAAVVWPYPPPEVLLGLLPSLDYFSPRISLGKTRSKLMRLAIRLCRNRWGNAASLRNPRRTRQTTEPVLPAA
jgi:hypothetical protein